MALNKYNIIFGLLLFIAFTSCTLYEDDTFLSFSKPEQRLTGRWGLEKVEKKGEDFTHEYYSFNRDVITEFYYNETYECFLNDSSVFYGIWYLAEEPIHQLTLQPVGSYNYQVYDILRLQSNHLWLKGFNIDFNDSLLFKYIKQ